MAHVVVIGGGVVGLSTAMLLAADGHVVTVLERDPSPPPASPDEAWAEWQRRGVNQFRQLHYFQPRFRAVIEAELPDVAAAADELGVLRMNPVAAAPVEFTGGTRHGDDVFEAMTARRPVMETAVARTAATTSRVHVRRGVSVTELLTGTSAASGIAHVVGVRTHNDDALPADLVVDASGRRSSLPALLTAAGARAPVEELEDSGFVYYGRHFRSSDGAVPPNLGPLLQHYGTVSVLTLPADNGTWGCGIITSAKDAPMRALRDPQRWEALWRRFPLVAHWADGQTISDGVAIMAKIEDRRRGFYVDGAPVATGLAAVGDAWACTNPSIGRGASIGLLHALALRDLVRDRPLHDPLAFACAWDAATQAVVEPWYRDTLHFDRHRLAEIEALARGDRYEPDDPQWEITQALQSAASSDPDVLRAALKIAGVIALPEEVLAEPGLLDKVIAAGADWRDEEIPAPDRRGLLAAVGA